jgi:biopolymer transport protein ExbB/TolQ
VEQTISVPTPAASDFSIYRLVMHSDPVVKGVLVLLLLASVACWAIIIEKFFRLILLNGQLRRLREAESGQGSSRSTKGLVRAILLAAAEEAKEPRSRRVAHGTSCQAGAPMRGALKTEFQRMEVGLPFLATVGSAAPFVGLFGTVWGIVNSFTSIAQQKDTSLAVVAPGIAEALIATALGLAAAIPAVVAYNQVAVSLGRASAKANASIAKIAKQLSRPQARPVLQSAAE